MNPAASNRRELLGWSAVLAANVALGRSAWARRGSGGWPGLGRSGLDELPGSRADEVGEIVRWIVTTPRDPVLRRVARELHAGLDPTRLLGAILVAAARDVAPDRASFNHAALLVSSIDQLAASAPDDERRRDVLWCLDYFKETQEADARSVDWRMPPVESTSLPAGAKARAALVDALDRWDPAAADVAIAGWVRSAPLDEVYALVWEYGLRCVANIGHKGIFAALSRRALPLAGERFAEDVLRSVVASFVPDGQPRKAEPFARSREILARGIAVRTRRDASDTGPARELLAALRRTTPEEVPTVVAKLVEDGAAPSGLWDAIVAAAAEISVANPTIGPLHASTSVNSLHYIALHAPSERLALLALLQAGAWMADFRLGLKGEAAAFRIDAVEPVRSTMDETLSEDSRGRTTVRGALWLGANESDRFSKHAHRLARTRGDDVHEFKMAAAALEEASTVGPWVRPFVCAALAVHLPAPSRADSTRLQRIRDALAVADTR